MYVYIEDIILVNFVADYIVLNRVLKKNCINRIMLCNILVSILETLFITLIFIKGYLYLSNIFKFLTLFVSAFFVTKPRKIKNFFKNLFLIYIYTFILAGAVLFVKYFSVKDPFYKMDYSVGLFDIVSGFFIGYVLIYIFDTFVFNKFVQISGTYGAEILFADKTVKDIFLYADTGNLIRTLSGDSVVVINNKIMKNICKTEKIRFDSYDEYLECYCSLDYDVFIHCGVIKVNTVSGGEYLLSVRVDKMIFGGKYIIENVTVVGGNFTYSEFDGIFNPIILTNRGNA